MSAALTAHADEVARRLRRSGYVGHTITLKIKLGQSRTRRAARVPGEDGDEPVYPLLTRAKTLRLPTDDGRVIRKIALELWDSAKIAEPVRLLGRVGLAAQRLAAVSARSVRGERAAQTPAGRGTGRDSRALWARRHRTCRRSLRKSDPDACEKNAASEALSRIGRPAGVARKIPMVFTS